MEKLRVRAYNVGFGDAIFISVPDSTADGERKTRHILIDVGSVKEKKVDGEGELYIESVIRNIVEVLDGKPLDLYIMTHEHMDHVKGLYYSAKELEPPLELKVQYAWLTASAEDGYYDRHEGVRQKLAEVQDMFKRVEAFTSVLQASDGKLPAGINSMLLNNNPRKTKPCVDYLQELATERTTYIHRGCDLNGTHPFREVTFDVWAPEEITTEYYGRFRPMNLNFIPLSRNGTGAEGSSKKIPASHPKPPKDVDPEGFKKLVESLGSGYIDNLLAIDKAANNTSIVFCLNWRGWKLLFAGDAEVRSWKTMGKHNVIEPVHFFKISHHGSINGMPPPRFLDVMFPGDSYDGREPKALLTSYKGVYNNVPDDTVTKILEERGVKVHSLSEGAALGNYIDIDFPAIE